MEQEKGRLGCRVLVVEVMIGGFVFDVMCMGV